MNYRPLQAMDCSNEMKNDQLMNISQVDPTSASLKTFDREVRDSPVTRTKSGARLKTSTRQPRILMVEDNWDHAYLELKALTAGGRYQVELVSSGAEALYKLTSGEFVLVLLDYCLSGMSGLSLIHKIAELQQDIPIVMITGLGSETVAVEAMKMGVYDYIVKSGDYLRALPLVVEKTLERYELRKVKEQWDCWIIKRNQELGDLSALGEAINHVLDTETLMAVASDKTVEILGGDYGKLCEATDIFIEAPASLEVCAAGTVVKNIVEREERAPSIVRQVAESSEPIIIENIGPEASENAFAWEHGLRSTLYLPIGSAQQVFGVLVIGSRKPLHFCAKEMAFYKIIAKQISVALDNAHLYGLLKKQAYQLGENMVRGDILTESPPVPQFDVEQAFGDACSRS
ncbi:MAG: response regulator [Acidobacteria bacterium]|nr:response regulator [Acidobacteriota bacterium]MBI3656690.1 response regulator [Acidobacteriota bacterium]